MFVFDTHFAINLRPAVLNIFYHRLEAFLQTRVLRRQDRMKKLIYYNQLKKKMKKANLDEIANQVAKLGNMINMIKQCEQILMTQRKKN